MIPQKMRGVLLLVAALATVALASDAADKNVLVLTDDTFDSALKTVPVALVEFYAPWCGHCKNLEPKWNEAADKLAAAGEGFDGARLAKIDADGEKKSGTRFRVSGFPTIKLFRYGQFAEDFEGDRSVEGVLEYLKQKNKVAVNKEVTSLATLKTILNAKNLERTAVVGFFADKNSVDFKYFSEVVVPFAGSGIDAYHTSSPAVLEGFGFYGSGSSITMYRPHGKPFKVPYRGTVFKQQLRDWIVENAVPAVGVYNKETESLYKLSSAALVRVVTESGQSPAGALEAAAKKFPAVKFATSAVADYKPDVEAQCGKEATFCLLGHEPTKGGKAGKLYGVAPATRDAAAIIAFTEDLIAKKLTVRVKSEPAGPAPKAGEVAAIVGSTFQSEVIDADKHVFIEFYAPWCGHCKALAPKFDELAKELQDKFSDLLIAKFDLTNNDLPEEYKSVFPVQGFPTLFLAKRGAKSKPTAYDSPREVADMKTWLEEKLKESA